MVSGVAPIGATRFHFKPGLIRGSIHGKRGAPRFGLLASRTDPLRITECGSGPVSSWFFGKNAALRRGIPGAIKTSIRIWLAFGGKKPRMEGKRGKNERGGI